jgi:hypothetical protein
MRFAKSLLFAASIAFGAGTAFAGQDSTVQGSVGDVIYIYPMEVTEYYLLIPSESSDMPG